MRSPVPRFSRYWVKDQHAWRDEEANSGFFRFDCPLSEFRRFGGSPNRLFKNKYRRQIDAIRGCYEKMYGAEILPQRRIHYVVLERAREPRGLSDMTSRTDVYLVFFKLRSEVVRVERACMVRGVMEE